MNGPRSCRTFSLLSKGLIRSSRKPGLEGYCRRTGATGAIVSALEIQSAAGSGILCSTPVGVTVHGLCPEIEGLRWSDLPPPLLTPGLSSQ